MLLHATIYDRLLWRLRPSAPSHLSILLLPLCIATTPPSTMHARSHCKNRAPIVAGNPGHIALQQVAIVPQSCMASMFRACLGLSSQTKLCLTRAYSDIDSATIKRCTCVQS